MDPESLSEWEEEKGQGRAQTGGWWWLEQRNPRSDKSINKVTRLIWLMSDVMCHNMTTYVILSCQKFNSSKSGKRYIS